MTQAFEYSIGRYKIRINVWLLIAFLLMQTLLNELGFWQLERAKEKQQRIELLEKGKSETVTELNSLTLQKIQSFQSVELALELSQSTMLLLDNKIDNKRPGYHVLNIAHDSQSNKNILVNRGWIYAGPNRNKLPEIELPDLNWQVSGRVYPLASESISTGKAEIEKLGGNFRLPVLDLKTKKELESKLNLSLEDYLIRIAPGNEFALKANWVWTNMPPEKHLGYAFQWFALALALLILSVIVCIKKR